jgi:hypothetical protein
MAQHLALQKTPTKGTVRRKLIKTTRQATAKQVQEALLEEVRVPTSFQAFALASGSPTLMSLM